MGLLADISDRFGGTEGMMKWLTDIPMCDPSECRFHGWLPAHFGVDEPQFHRKAA